MVGASSAHSAASACRARSAARAQSASISRARLGEQGRGRVEYRHREHGRAIVAEPHRPAAHAVELDLGGASEHVAEEEPLAQDRLAHLGRDAAHGGRGDDGERRRGL